MKKITIVTVNLNNVETIEKTIQSILNQNYPKLEYIFIDGASSDGSLNIINKYKDKFNYFISESDKGVFDAMNKGIAQASGDYIGFVNGGDLIYENSLSQINEIFSKQKDKFFFSVADLDYIDANNNIVGSRACRSKEEIIKRRFIEMPTNHLGIFVPLETFKKYGLFDLRLKYRADFLFILRLMDNGYLPINIQKKIGAFRLGGMSGGYSTYIENFKVIKLLNKNLFLGLYSTLLGLSKLFLQKNFPAFCKFIVKLYYKFNIYPNKNKTLKKNDFKIIQIIDHDVGGGAEKIVYNLSKNLDCTNKIVTLRKLSNENNLNPNYFSLNVEKYYLINIKTEAIISIFIGFFALLKFLYNIKDKNLILHSHLSRSLYVTFLASIFFKFIHIHTEHNTFNKRRSKSYLYLIEYLIYNSLNHIICVSEATRYELLRYMPNIKLNNISVIENGTKLYEHKIRNFNKDKYNILILGSLTNKKGIDLFINVLPFLLDRVNQVRIVGSGQEKKNLLDLAKKLSLESVIKFIPFVEDPSEYIYDSDIGVIPSRWEGFGLVALEMRSSGMPILISNISALESLFSGYNGVFLFEKESQESLKNSFIKMLYDLKKGKIKVEDINTNLKIFSVESFIERYRKVYKEILSK